MNYYDFEKDMCNFNIKYMKKQFKLSIFLILLCIGGILIDFPGLIITSPNKFGCFCIGINVANILFMLCHFIFETIEYKDLLTRKRRLDEFEIKRQQDLHDGVHPGIAGLSDSSSSGLPK